MRAFIIALAGAGVLALSGVSPAAQISSPMVFGNVSQDRAECVVVNGGTAPLTVTLKIVDEAGATKVTSNCDGSIPAGDFCDLIMPVGFVGAFSCTATAPSVTNLRGALVLEDKVLDSFGLFQFRAIRSEQLR